MKHVIITGASGNLGQAAVERFSGDGYHVIATVTPGKRLPFPVGENVETIEADLSNDESVASVIAAVVEKYKTIDAALLLVGGYASGDIRETDNSLLQKMFSVNFATAYFISRILFQHMLQQQSRGRIVFVGSRAALKPLEGKNSLAYALSKSLLFNLAEILNAEGSKHDVTCSIVVPSTIDTFVNRQAMPDADFDKWVKPQEVADAMASICADENKSWRGTVLKVYGRA
jgi:NAD(P)-dependent dehydrogenase (short-subunit alcohol dehydrogenase family)